MESTSHLQKKCHKVSSGRDRQPLSVAFFAAADDPHLLGQTPACSAKRSYIKSFTDDVGVVRLYLEAVLMVICPPGKDAGS